MVKTYGGGLFEPLSRAQFSTLRAQFKALLVNCQHKQIGYDPSCNHGYGEVWSCARHSVRTRQDVARERSSRA